METITREYTVYKFEELSEKAQQKALEKLYDINYSHDWWEFSYEYFIEQLNEIGLTCDKFYFDLDRNRYIEPINLRFTDVKKFIHSSIDEKVKTSLIDIADLYLTTACYSRHTKPVVESYAKTLIQHQRLNTAINSLVNRCRDKIHDLLEDFSIALQNESDYLGSEEAIKETIEANEYTFTEDGNLFS